MVLPDGVHRLLAGSTARRHRLTPLQRRPNGHSGAAGRRGAAGGCDEDRVGPRVEGACRRARATDSPAPQDMVTVHYTGWTTDGKMFDSSHARGKPSTFGVEQRHQGLGRGRAADDRSARSGGSGFRRRSPITGKRDPPQGMLVFDVELLDIAAVAARRAARRRRRHRPTRRRRRRGSPTRCCSPGRAPTHPEQDQPRDGALHGLDDRRQDVRQLGRTRRAGHLRARRSHRRAGPKACS